MDGTTAFSLAAMNGHDVIAKLLFDKGADSDLFDWEKQTELHKALYYKDGFHGATSVTDWNSKGGNGWTLLHYIAFRGTGSTLKFVLERGAEPDLENNAGETPLLLAVRRDQGTAVKLLADYCLRKRDVQLDFNTINLDLPALKLAAETGGHNAVLKACEAFDHIEQESAPPAPTSTETGP